MSKLGKFTAACAAVVCVLSLQAAPERRAKMRVADVSINTSLDNFPVLVKLSESRIDGFAYADCAAGGADLSFTLEDGTLLDHEVDTWNTEGESLVWVNLPKFARNAVFYVRWKDSAPPTVSAPAVWTKAGYLAVWHFNEASGDAVDSVKGYVARPMGLQADQSVAFDDGAVGTARWCAKASGTGVDKAYLSLVDLPREAFVDSFTLSAWTYIQSTGSCWWYGNKNAASENGFHAASGGCYNNKFCPNIYGCGATTGYKGNQTADCNPNRWMNLDFIYSNAGTFTLRIDGVSKVSNTAVIRDETDGYASANAFAFGSSADGSASALVGKVDELRIFGGEKSGDWATAESEQVNKAGFLAQVGETETLGDCVMVRSAGAQFASEGLPAYGRTASTVGTTYTFDAPASIAVQPTVTATCMGWSLVRISDGTVVRTSESPADGESATRCIVDYAEPVQLTWIWSVEITDGPITYYVSPTGDASDGLSWATAFRTPQDALALASGTAEKPCTILIGDGVYNTVGGADGCVLHVTKSHVSFVSANGPAAAIFDGGRTDTYRPLKIDEKLTDVLVAGLTLTNGWNTTTGTGGASSIWAGSGTMSNLVVASVSRNRTNPVYLKGTACIVGSKLNGAAIEKFDSFLQGDNAWIVLDGNAGLVDCEVYGLKVMPGSGNSSVTDTADAAVKLLGVGAYLRGCLIHDNVCGRGPQGAYGFIKGCVYASNGTIESCTIANNTVYGYGGLYVAAKSVTVKNCIVWGNAASKDGQNLTIAANVTPMVTYTDASELQAAVSGNFNADPKFADADGGDFTPSVDSPLAGKGQVDETWMPGAKDILGHMRVWTDGTVTPGACEPQGRYAGAIADFSVSGAKQGRAPLGTSFHAEASGGTGPYTFTWDFGDGSDPVVTTDADVTYNYGNPGAYSVSLVVTPAEGAPVTVPAKPACVIAVGDVCYVSETGSATPPYDTWEKATASIEDAIAMEPDTVLVTNGTYQLTNPNGIELTRAMRVCSVEGAGVTRVRGPVNSTMTRRSVSMSHSEASIEGFDFLATYHVAFSVSAGTLSHCIVTNAKDICKVFHAEISGGTVSDCRFDFTGSNPYDANIVNNAAGIHLSGSAVLERCEIANYKVSYPDSASNWASVGGVRMDGRSTLRNCYVHGNSARAKSYVTGGGVSVGGTGCTVDNCTVVSNQVSTATDGTCLGGGIYVSGTNAKIRNSIASGNSVNGVSHDLSLATSATGLVFENNLVANAAELPEGAVDCIGDADPLFADDGAGYRITKDSPCRNAGCKVDWAMKKGMATDIDGQERCCGPIDIGCWELQLPPGLILLVR